MFYKDIPPIFFTQYPQLNLKTTIVKCNSCKSEWYLEKDAETTVNTNHLHELFLNWKKFHLHSRFSFMFPFTTRVVR